jgi:hypothetical protein
MDLQRINMVIHPYLFHELKNLNRDQKTNVHNSLFKCYESDFLKVNDNENVSFIYFLFAFFNTS